jgi:hypothetical protein
MGLFEFIIVLVLISSISSVMKEWRKNSGGKASKELLSEMKTLREEMKRLRQQNNDVILSLDTAVNRVDRRLHHLEARTLPPGEGGILSDEERARLLSGR